MFALVLMLVGITGCLDRPRHGELLPPNGTMSPVSGLVTKPNSFVKYYMRSGPGQSWRDMANGATSGTEAFRDAAGMDWYRFTSNYTFPLSKQTWRKASSSSGSQRRVVAEFNARGVDGNLATFDTNADACGESHSSGGLIEILNNCTSSKSPYAEVFRKCGKADQDCCLATDIDAVDACDDGRKCSTASRCTIPSGGLNQVCNADNSCNNSRLGCIAGTCRNTTNEQLPIVMLDLEIRTCSDATLLNNGNSAAALELELGTGERFYIHTPDDAGRLGQTDTYGIRMADIGTLGDIGDLTLYAYRDKMCIDRIRLLADGVRVFEKTYTRPLTLDPTLPGRNYDMTIIRSDELRTHWTGLATAPMCAQPTSWSGAQLKRAITGSIGNSLRAPDPAAFKPCVDGPDRDEVANECPGTLACTGSTSGLCYPTIEDLHFGSVSVTSKLDDASTLSPKPRTILRVDATVTGHRRGSSYDGANFDAKVELEFRIGCADHALGLTNTYKNVRVTEVRFDDPGVNILNALSSNLLKAFATLFANGSIDEESLGLDSALAGFMQDVAQCPAPTFSSATPPALLLNISSFDRCDYLP